MTAQLIDGRALAERIRGSLRDRITRLRRSGLAPSLDAVLVGTEDNAARQYAESQGRQCEALGIEFRLHELSAGSRYEDIAGRVLLLNTDDDVTGIMVHLPLPDGVDEYRIQRLIAPEKDVEGVNPANIGNVVYGRSSLVPCTALAAMRMIESTGVGLRGKRAVVVGAGNVVGKPLAVLLMRAEATVVSCNVHTPDVPALTREADVLVAAAGVPGLITADMVKPGRWSLMWASTGCPTATAPHGPAAMWILSGQRGRGLALARARGGRPGHGGDAAEQRCGRRRPGCCQLTQSPALS